MPLATKYAINNTSGVEVYEQFVDGVGGDISGFHNYEGKEIYLKFFAIVSIQTIFQPAIIYSVMTGSLLLNWTVINITFFSRHLAYFIEHYSQVLLIVSAYLFESGFKMGLTVISVLDISVREG